MRYEAARNLRERIARSQLSGVSDTYLRDYDANNDNGWSVGVIANGEVYEVRRYQGLLDLLRGGK